MTSVTQPQIAHAQIVTDAQQSLMDTARKLKAVALDTDDQKTSAALLRLVDRARRAALIAQTLVADLANEAARRDLENDGPLPPDPSGSASGPLMMSPVSTIAPPTQPLTPPLFLQDQPNASQPS